MAETLEEVDVTSVEESTVIETPARAICVDGIAGHLTFNHRSKVPLGPRVSEVIYSD